MQTLETFGEKEMREEGRVYSKYLDLLGITSTDLIDYVNQEGDIEDPLKYDEERKDCYMSRCDTFAMLKFKHGKLNNVIFQSVREYTESFYFEDEVEVEG